MSAVPVVKPKPKIWSDLAAALDGVTHQRRWFAEGAIEGCPIVVLTAPEKSGKSWALLDLTVATVVGGAWCGVFPIQKPGPVIYVDAELGQHEFARRIARVARGHGHAPHDVVAGVRHITTPAPILDLNEYRDRDAQGSRLLANMAAEKPSLVILDPYRNLIPGHENDAKDAVAAVKVMARIRDTLEVPVLVAHHLNKAGGFSGSRAFKGLADLIIEGTDEPQPWYGAVGRTLRRDDPITRRFTIGVEHQQDDDDTRAATRLRLRFEGDRAGRTSMSKPAQLVLAELQAVTGPVPPGHLQRRTKRNSETVQRALAELQAAGLATPKGKLWELSTPAFLADVDEHAKQHAHAPKVVNGQPERVTTDHGVTSEEEMELV